MSNNLPFNIPPSPPLGYPKCATINSLVTGCGVDIVFAWLFLYKWQLGIRGAAMVQIIVKATRNLLWIAFILYYRLGRTLFISSSKEPLLNMKEFRVFAAQAWPNVLSNLSGWFIFELQIMAIANIKGITNAQLAAGAIWVQCESALASIQSGWLNVIQMRTMNLLGKQDPGARKSFFLLCTISFLLVLLTNIPVLIWSDGVAGLVSNKVDVQNVFKQLSWVLVFHSQTRVCSITASFLLIPMGRGTFGVLLCFVCFYLIASPVAGTAALSDYITTSVITKMLFCVSTSAIAQTCIAVVGYLFLLRINWGETAAIINARANTDTESALVASPWPGSPRSASGLSPRSLAPPLPKPPLPKRQRSA